MTLNVTADFPDTSPDLGDELVVRRYELRETLGALFELTLEVLSTNPAVNEGTIVGQAVSVSFGDEPFLQQIRGIVRAQEQRTAVPSGHSLYVWTIVPPLWLTTRRRDSRVFQQMSTPEIVAAVLASPSYGGRISAPDSNAVSGTPKHEYVVQYAESDHEFIARILADEGITGYFDHSNGSTWTLTNDTTSTALASAGEIPFSDPTHQNPIVLGNPATAHVQTAVICTQLETSAVTLRDYDFEKPDLLLEAKKDAGDDAPLEAYTFEVGKFAQQLPGDVRAQRQLDGFHAPQRRIRCATSFALAPGASFTLVDHPRDDLATDFLVVGARTVMDGNGRGTHELELQDLDRPFRPAQRPKPRIHGTQTALVVGAEGAEIDVDKFGRVHIEFRWDRRDRHTGETSRRVRVSQGWAGADRGFVMLPRVKDEVVVAYLDGDPDQPLIVGRVHNGVSTAPLSLPGEKAISVWRSKSTPGGAGFNQILFDDAAGAERLEMHAERDFRSDTGRNATTVVGNDEEHTVVGNQKLTVQGNQTISVKGTKRMGVAGKTFVNGTDMSLEAKNLKVDADKIDVGGSDIIMHSDGQITIMATTISIQAGEGGASSIEMSAGEIVIKSPMIKLNP